MKHEEIDLSKIRTISIDKRKSKVSLRDMAGIYDPGSSFRSFFDTLPPILKSNEIKAVVKAGVEACRNEHARIWVMVA